ncbi:MAG: hypothetical protein WDZ75_01305 [Candidatus Paceibacterota bacterium]
MANNADIITHLTYTELFDSVEKNGILVPCSTLKASRDVEDQIRHLLKDINTAELIQFSSFLNMICQSTSKEMVLVRGVSLLEETELIKKGTGFRHRIVFHRDNLLNLISQILEKNLSGANLMTGTGDITNARKYTQAVLLNNDLLNLETSDSPISPKEMIMRDYFIREWPHYYIRDISNNIYKHRIIRYRYCYEDLLPKLGDAHKQIMENAVKAFERDVGVNLIDYLHVVTGLYGWFLDWPLRRDKDVEQGKEVSKQKFGFDFKNVDSFYINTQSFAKDPTFIRIIDTLSRDIKDLRTAVEKEKNRERDVINGYNKYVRVFFDNPVFKISDDRYCIIDLKFLLENACGGLLWRLRSQEDIQNYKSAYGYLMEEYFRFLIKKVFGGAKITFDDATGVDAIVEQDDNVLVIEFTTEYYRLSSLYDDSVEGFIDDAYKVLFNSGAEDIRGRGKGDKGKLLKLNDYVEKLKQDGKKIIPILVTENFIGNPDLLDEFSNFYTNEISEKKLTNLQENKPLLLCLDDLEVFWGLFETKDAVNGLAGFVEYWNPLDKGPQFHNASSGICRYVEGQRNGEARITNKEYAEFFSPKSMYGYKNDASQAQTINGSKK